MGQISKNTYALMNAKKSLTVFYAFTCVLLNLGMSEEIFLDYRSDLTKVKLLDLFYEFSYRNYDGKQHPLD